MADLILHPIRLKKLAEEWLLEDSSGFDVGGGVAGSNYTTFDILYKSKGCIAGLPFANAICTQLGVETKWLYREGHVITEPVQIIGTIQGPANSILLAERIVLNVLSRASGIATNAMEMSRKLTEINWPGILAGTRKTTPGFRLVEKYALVIGGVDPHRYDLSSLVMLKDNHISICGSISQAVLKAKALSSFSQKIEVECASLQDALEAGESGCDIIMLDNFDPPAINTMSTLNTLIQKASSFLKIGLADAPSKETFDSEITFYKNNVCVHPPTSLRTEITHHPGYLTIREQKDEVLGSTLILTWVPNVMLKKNPRSLENKTPESSPCRSSYSSKCPSPTPSGKSPLHLPYSGPGSPYGYCEKSIDDFLHFRPHSRYSDRKSISSTISDIGSPREDCGSLDSFSVSDHTDMNASICSQSLMNELDDSKSNDTSLPNSTVSCKMESSMSSVTNEVQSQSDSGIGPEEVVAALEKMICGLNNIDHTKAESDVGHNDSAVILNTALRSQNSDMASANVECLPEEDSKQTDSIDCNIEKCLEKKNELRLCLPQNLNADVQYETSTNPAISISTHSPVHTDSSSITQTTSNRDPDSMPSTPGSLANSPHHQISKFLYVQGTAESVAQLHNLNFPDMASRSSHKCCARENTCGVFSVDLSQMRSLRLFFSNKESTCGQLVIASRESQYKILHFHHGGLNKLAEIFEEYNFLAKPQNQGTENCPYKQFSICRPEVTKEECHPEEGIYNSVNEITWRAFVNSEGMIEDDLQLRKEIFFGGLDPKIRREAWPFLLHHYEFSSSFDEREQLRNDKYIEYQGIRWKREQMTEEEKDVFWRNIQCTVEKDVVRTDRNNPFFFGENNPNVEIMMNILLNYGFYNPKIGYTQGMSDLLAPILAVVQDESDSFWCFVGLMQRTIFVTCPKDFDMDVNLHFLRELFRLMTPKFYQHLCKYEALELLFVHRWILLCFKREFAESEAMRMWEACWTHYQTDYFHLFICCAIVAVYGDDVITQGLRADEMMVHFSSLAMHMNGELILRKARGLLHQFRVLSKIPCSLSKLCELCGPGMWDSRHVPIVYCTGNHEDHFCPYEGENPILKSP